MNIQINAVGFNADKKLEEYVISKVEKVGKYFDGIVGAEVFLKLENGQSLENKTSEVKLFIPGNDAFAKKTCKSFEEATDEAIEALKKQLEKYKEKIKRN